MVKCVMRYLNLNQILGVINGVFLNDQKFSDWAPNENVANKRQLKYR